MKKLQAVSTTLLLKPLLALDLDDATGLRKAGAILLPDNAQGPDSPIIEFEVISAGPDCKTVMDGNRILCNGTIAMKLPLPDGRIVAMIKEESIVAVLGDELKKTT